MEKGSTDYVIFKGNMMKPFITKTQTPFFKCTLSVRNYKWANTVTTIRLVHRSPAFDSQLSKSVG